VMKWLKENGYPWGISTCNQAAEHGNLEALKWLREQGCPWDRTTSVAAMSSGHFKIFMWAMENGCPLDDNSCCSLAATWNHFALLKRLCALGCQMNPIPVTIRLHAASNGNLEMLKWVVERGSPLRLDILRVAARNRDLEMCKWVMENGIQPTAELIKDPEIIQWAEETGVWE